jgi:hypothetical protein
VSRQRSRRPHHHPSRIGDSADLQALFDSVAASVAPPPVKVVAGDTAADSDELQALFDSVSQCQSGPRRGTSADFRSGVTRKSYSIVWAT